MSSPEWLAYWKRICLIPEVDFLVDRAKDPSFDPFSGASMTILVTTDKSSRFLEFDCAVASENLMNSAEPLGLGLHVIATTEFILASEKGREFKRELRIPKDVSTYA